MREALEVRSARRNKVDKSFCSSFFQKACGCRAEPDVSALSFLIAFFFAPVLPKKKAGKDYNETALVR